MAISNQLAEFIRGAFPSVWSLELLLLLKSEPDHAWSGSELVERLRASDHVVVQGVGALVAGGLIATEEGGRVRYAPASPEIARLADEAIHQYAKRPDAVRRIIVFAGNTGLQAFSDAFNLRKD
ncbi:hypothetical protein ACFOMD_09775 [Sphingoaurantiacus capsulatus]|uniref:Transcriptional regulator n=1 Tax=Sphingoaurantiacus capsulatus TaxID=1771310 RepID=A0ABV7XDZ3_9SPHN